MGQRVLHETNTILTLQSIPGEVAAILMELTV